MDGLPLHCLCDAFLKPPIDHRRLPLDSGIFRCILLLSFILTRLSGSENPSPDAGLYIVTPSRQARKTLELRPSLCRAPLARSRIRQGLAIQRPSVEAE